MRNRAIRERLLEMKKPDLVGFVLRIVGQDRYSVAAE